MTMRRNPERQSSSASSTLTWALSIGTIVAVAGSAAWWSYHLRRRRRDGNHRDDGAVFRIINYILDIRRSLRQAKKESQKIEKDEASCEERNGEESKEEAFVESKTLTRGGNFEYLPHNKQKQSVPVAIAGHIDDIRQEQLLSISSFSANENKEIESCDDASNALPLDHPSLRMTQNDADDDFASHPPQHDSIDQKNSQVVEETPFKLPKADNTSSDDSMETASTTTATTVESLPTTRPRQIFGSRVTANYNG
jgi:hypothetical protein